MDDFSTVSLSESKNEWCSRLLNIMSPCIMQGLKSIFDEAWILCKNNKEEDKYLMTFQNFLSRVPKWNQTIIDTEKNRIAETSSCTYLEELITCVHIIQLKALSCVRVGQKQKKIDIDVPSTSTFVHKVYIHLARKIYMNIYLFEKNIPPLQTQKNNREIEIIVKECILNSVRDSVPIETILRAYMDETEEQDVEVKEVEEELEPKLVPDTSVADTNAADTNAADTNAADTNAADTNAADTSVADTDTISIDTNNALSDVSSDKPEHAQTSNFGINSSDTEVVSTTKISFSDNDTSIDTSGITSVINAPKDEDSLENLESQRNNNDGNDDDDDDDDEQRLVIGDKVNLDITDINDLNKSSSVALSSPVLDFEVLT